MTSIVPINGDQERLGTLLLARFDKDFTDDDLVLVEYSATIIIEISAKNDLIEEARRKQ